jgi:enoyl-CoA hydratase/carnithine racemase
MTHLRYRIDGNLAFIALAYPPQNRITDLMSEELGEALAKIATSGARALLLSADGPNFCLGGDIHPWPSLASAELRELFARHLAVFNTFESLPIPTIAAVQGL